ncbi:Gfo/Idh/MocA family protein [Piscinibacter sp. HJYY11]|uniref:Gfo/Idh/MocA family protein n=1 Tax=Piscinibacter sp. HJYY11 TaxID=2801333 RepID=UPI00191D76F4|nr:Gfo/Idh/MocA family oxidoreductase [Piscinibacter sp. HJYY11]MBL0727362.1 Gfo/Idh/MocA family oxidoreductase [Piscinibacter sp. HJYY11]
MINVAIVGCGRIAKRHAELLTQHVAGMRLVAVCDHHAGRAEAFGARHGVPAFESLAEMLAMRGIDLVAVLTPSGEHAEHAIAAMRSGRHVLVEKPMALTLTDADAMLDESERAGVQLFVVKQNRFNVPVVRAREALEAGRFGQLVLGTVRVRWCREAAYYDEAAWRGTWALDGGVLANQASHHVDMLRWFMGPVASVHARGATALARIEAEDTAVATLRFRNGALGVIEATTAARPHDMEGSLSVLGSTGAVEIAGFAVNQTRIWQFNEPLPGDADALTRFSVNPPNVYGFGHQAFYEHVVEVLGGRAAPLVDGHEGRGTLELLVALYESMASGEEVALPVQGVRHSRLGRRASVPASAWAAWEAAS